MASKKNLELREYVKTCHAQSMPIADIARHVGKSPSLISRLVGQLDREDYLQERINRRGMSTHSREAIDYLDKILTLPEYAEGDFKLEELAQLCDEAGIKVNTHSLHYLLRRLGWKKKWVKE